MNKNIILTIVAAAIILFAGCKKDENDNSNGPKKSQLKNELILLNQSIMFSPIDDSKGLNWKEKAKKALAIAAADVLGAGAGVKAGGAIAGAVGLATGGTGAVVVAAGCGVVCGAAASVAVGSASANGHTGNGIGYPFEVDIHSYGYLHNQIVEQHYAENPLPLIDILNRANIKNADIIIMLYQSNPYQQFMQKFLIYTEEYANSFKITEFIKKCDYISENEALVLDYFFKEFLQIENETDILRVVQTYKTFVTQTSLLSQEEKEALLVSLSVAQYSPFYWVSVIQ